MSAGKSAEVELKAWKQACEDSRNVLSFYEKRADKFKARIRALEHEVRELKKVTA